MLHPELAGLLAATEAAEAEAQGIVDGLTDVQANWQPHNGRGWSVAQCLDHLAKMNCFYVGHFLPAVEKSRKERGAPFRDLKPTWVGRQFISSFEPPPKIRMKAPSISVPASSLSAAATLEAYVRSHDDYRRMVRAANDVDVNRVTAHNPFIKAVRMRVATVLLIVPAHDRRHLWQARQVLRAPGFPS